jgi:hypothetical protein
MRQSSSDDDGGGDGCLPPHFRYADCIRGEQDGCRQCERELPLTRSADGRNRSPVAQPRSALSLDNLCWVFDNNHITIEGNTRIAFTEDIAARFLGYGSDQMDETLRRLPRSVSRAGDGN